ncbi:Ig-like domain-containing protein [Hyalangium gracile]|uniref:Ig-like domain-containing protein n=1 Tax=Hyalangium gracile TaxID=394092 RepID=UPI001CCC3771|nr:Ig-like domain-containing protein [Hyalangium gracile]
MLLVRCVDEQPDVNVRSISVSPRAVNLGFGQQQRFTATVLGFENTAVTWSLFEGASAGTIDADGLYTAPSVAGTYHVVAVSQVDPSRSSSATVNVRATEQPVAVSLSPAAARLTVSTSQQFTATVTGTANTAVSWSVTEAGGGTVSASGLYTAPSTPGTYHVVATSASDPTKSATATVTVEPVQTIIVVSVSPSTANLLTGETRTFTATVTGTTNTAVSWSVTEAGGGTVSASGLYTAPSTPGTYHVVATSAADPTKSATATVTVTAAITVTVSPTTATLVIGEPQQFTATVGNTSNNAVTWTIQEGAAGGSVDASGLYTAPVTPGTYHVVATSEADPTKSATATVTVTPFPTAGLALHFSADQLLGPTGTLPADGAAVSTWVDLSGNGGDLGQTEANRQPIFKSAGLNGLPTVAFDGSTTAGEGDYLRTAAFASALPQPLTVFFVYKAPPVSANRTLLDAPPATGTQRIRVQATTVPVGALQLYTSAFTSPGTAKTTGSFYYVTAVYAGANSRLRANGLDETLNNRDPGPMGMAGLMLAGRQDLLNTAFAQTEFAELLVFSRVLSDTELGQVEAYLMNRYFP